MSFASFSTLPPEIIYIIASYLSLHDLAQCLRLSRNYTTIFTPLFWRILHANTRFFCDDTDTPLNAFLNNKHHVQHLVLTNPYVAQILALKLQGEGTLRSLHVSFPQEAGSIFSMIDSRPERSLATVRKENAENFGNARVVELFLVRNWNLRELVLDESCFRNRDGSDAFSMVMAVCPIARLERLEIRFGRCSYRSSMAVTSTPPPIYCMDNLLTFLVSAMELIDAFGWFQNLRELVISGGNRHIEFSRLGFLVRCLRVEKIRLENLDNVAMVSLGTALPHCCMLLTHLDWRGPSTGMDLEIAKLLEASQSGWKEVSLPDMLTFGPLSTETLMKGVSTTLEVLKVGGWGYNQDVEFLEILCSARNLRRLEGPADGMASEETQEFTLWGYWAYEKHKQDMDRTWVLGPSMEYLQLRIEEVPRPDVVCRRNGGPVTIPGDLLSNTDSNKQRYKVQRWIYTQLGRLTGLQELILGVRKPDPKVLKRAGLKMDADLESIEAEMLKDVYPLFIYHGLEFSLKSGLKLLAGLKKLKVLDVWGTAHRIGVKELEWMRKNWPRLREVRGLVSKREWTGDVEAGLASKDAVETWLARHKNGIGSYYPESISI